MSKFTKEIFKIATLDITLKEKKLLAKSQGLIQADVVRCLKYLQEMRDKKNKLREFYNKKMKILIHQSLDCEKLKFGIRPLKNMKLIFLIKSCSRLEEFIRHPSDYQMQYLIGDNFDVSFDFEYNGYYKGNFKTYPKKDWICRITLPHDFLQNPCYFDNSDNILTFYRKHDRKNIGNVSLIKGYKISFPKSCGSITLTPVFIAKYIDISYHHANSLEEAIKGLRKKKKRLDKIDVPIFFHLHSFITKNDYAKITGACKFGIDEWCKENSISSKKLKVADLLRLLRNKSAYGYERFFDVLIKNLASIRKLYYYEWGNEELGNVSIWCLYDSSVYSLGQIKRDKLPIGSIFDCPYP